jgi:hypothetical protein
MKIWHMHIVCCISKATKTLSESVILIASPLEQWMRGRTPMSHYTYISSLVYFYNFQSQSLLQKTKINWKLFLIKPRDALISQIYFCQEILHVSDSSPAHHQEFSTVRSALVYVLQGWWHTPVPNVQWKTPDNGQRNCPKHVEVTDKNKFGNLVRLFVLLKINLLRCTVTWT